MPRTSWAMSPLGRLSHTVMESRGEEILSMLPGFGVDPRPGNRLEAAWKTLQRHRTPDALSDPGARARIADALHAVFQAVTIVEGHRHDLAQGGGRDRAPLFSVWQLSQLVDGALPTTERGDRPADHRFECFMGALFRLSALHVSRAEPDWRVLYRNGEILGVAVKRLNAPTAEAALRLIKKGAAQLRRQKLRGIVVLNVEGLVQGIDTDTEVEAFGQAFNARLKALQDSLDSLVRYPELVAVMFTGIISRWITPADKPPTFHFSHPVKVIGFSDVESPDHFDAFFRYGLMPRMDNALTHVTDLVSPRWLSVNSARSM